MRDAADKGNAMGPEETREVPADSRGWAVAVAALVLAAGCLAHFLFGFYSLDRGGHAWGSDDAYISFRYARNLVDGHGLVYNPGERVEGYSNLLWTLLVAGGMRAGFDAHPFSVFVGISFALAALLIYHERARRALGATRAAAAAMVLAVCPPIWLWSTSGLETPLVLLVQLALWVALDRLADGQTRGSVWLLCASAAVSVLVRCDGFVVPIFAVGWLVATRRFRVAAALSATVAGVMIPYLLWRHQYYGDWLPNVYYAKVCGAIGWRLAAGARHLGLLLVKEGLIAPVTALLVSLIVVLRRRAAPRFEHVLGVGLIGYWLYVGGDAFHERFLLVLWPLGAFALLRLLPETRPGRAVVAAVVIFALVQQIPVFVDARYHWSGAKFDRWLTLGEFLREHHAGQTLAIDAAGKVPFVSGMPTIDMLGLNDRTLARMDKPFVYVGHNTYDADYVLGRKPDVIAAWTSSSLDLMWGLARSRYEASGYRRTYLVNGKPGSREPNIIDVRGMSESQTRALIADGYTYAVLVRGP